MKETLYFHIFKWCTLYTTLFSQNSPWTEAYNPQILRPQWFSDPTFSLKKLFSTRKLRHPKSYTQDASKWVYCQKVAFPCVWVCVCVHNSKGFLRTFVINSSKSLFTAFFSQLNKIKYLLKIFASNTAISTLFPQYYRSFSLLSPHAGGHSSLFNLNQAPPTRMQKPGWENNSYT